MDIIVEQLGRLSQRMERMEGMLAEVHRQRTVKDWYSTEDRAKILGRSEFTVREWCRLDRIHTDKKGSGRGKYQAWVVSHAELQRYLWEGLLRPGAADGTCRPRH